MVKFHKVSKVFIKFFLTHLLILVIPLLIAGLFAGNIIRKIMIEQIAVDEMNTLSRYSEGINSELQKIIDITFKATNEKEFSPHIISNFSDNALPIMSRLRNYRTANSFIYDIYLVSDYCDYVYSATTSYTTQRFIDQKLDRSVSEDEMFSILSKANPDKLNGNIISPPEDSKGGFYLVSTLPNVGTKHYAYLVFEISKQYLKDTSNLFAEHGNKNFMIIYDDYILVASSNCDTKLQLEVLKQIETNNLQQKNGTLEVTVDGKIINGCFSRVASTNWICVSTLPKTDALGQVNSVVVSFILVLIVLLIVGIIAIYILTQLNYSPIKKLANTAGMLFSKSNPNGRKDEINYLKRVMDETYQSIEESSFDQHTSLVARQYFLIKNLVNGVQYSQEDLKSLLEKTCIDFYPSNFFVVLFHVHIRKNNIQENILNINDYIDTYQFPNIRGLAANLYGENIVAIFSCSHNDVYNINSDLENLRQSVCLKFDVLITLGVGRLQLDLTTISNSFIEASTALDYRLIAGKNKLISFYDLKINSYTDIAYPQNYIDNLCTSIRNGQQNMVGVNLKNLLTHVRENASSMYVAKLLCYDVINSVIKTLKIIDITANFDLQYPNLISLAKFETMEDLEKTLANFCFQSCEHVNSLHTIALSDKAINYMKKNLFNPDFSINSIAQNLQVSAPHLSRTFKEQKGITITDYVKFHKIDLAKKMLVETNDSVDKIIHLLGYYDASSFIKKFKLSEGVTPGEYRKRKL